MAEEKKKENVIEKWLNYLKLGFIGTVIVIVAVQIIKELPSLLG